MVINQLKQDYMFLLCSVIISHKVTEAGANVLSMASVRESHHSLILSS